MIKSSDLVQILIAMLGFRENGSSPGPSFVAGVLGETTMHVASLYRILEARKQITQHKGEWVVTVQGREEVERCIDSPVVRQSPLKWKLEALTGICEKKSKASGYLVTEESQITRGVLPTVGRPVDPGPNPEEMIITKSDMNRAAKYIMEELGISREEYNSYMAEERIRICGEGKKHIGIFSKKGDRWQHVCRDCWKKKYGVKK